MQALCAGGRGGQLKRCQARLLGEPGDVGHCPTNRLPHPSACDQSQGLDTYRNDVAMPFTAARVVIASISIHMQMRSALRAYTESALAFPDGAHMGLWLLRTGRDPLLTFEAACDVGRVYRLE